MIKVVQVNVVANKGSTGRIAEDIGKLILENGWDSYIAYGRKSSDSNSKLIRIGTTLETLYHVFLTRFFNKHGFGSNFATLRFIRRLKKIKPHIIHLHNIHGYYLNLPLLFRYLKKNDVKVVWTLHDCWAFTGHCAHYTQVNCYKWLEECSNCPQIKSYPKSYFVDNSKPNFHKKKKLFNLRNDVHIVTVSNWLQKEASRSFLSDLSIQTIHNAIDIDVFNEKGHVNLRSRYGLDNKIIILGVANIWGIRKGLYEFHKLLGVISSEYQIVLIGLTQEQINELPHGILGIERTKDLQELVNWYSTADVYVNLSFEESFGMTSVEALACGTPIVVYDSTALPEIVNDDVGFVVEKNNIEGIKTAIEKLRENNYSQYSQSCRKHVEENFEIRKNYSSYLELYNRLLLNE